MRTGSIYVAALALGVTLSACADETGSEAGGVETSDADASDASSSDSSAGESDDGTDTSSGDSDASSTDSASSSDDTTDSGDTADGSDSGDGQPCSYPAGAVEPMALGEVLSPYAWPEAIRADGLTAPLDLGNAPCDADDVIDWTPRDVIVFISWPAW